MSHSSDLIGKALGYFSWEKQIKNISLKHVGNKLERFSRHFDSKILDVRQRPLASGLYLNKGG